jgi:hypothetical protein
MFFLGQGQPVSEVEPAAGLSLAGLDPAVPRGDALQCGKARGKSRVCHVARSAPSPAPPAAPYQRIFIHRWLDITFSYI